MTPIDAVIVAVPAHDEEELLEACLRSVRIALAAAEPRVRAVAACVALDRCTDASSRIARACGVPAVVVDAGAVGAARAAATTRALALIGGVPLPRVWTAHTDADSVVPAHWLTHQLDLAAAGAEVVVGTVRPRFDDLRDEQVRAWQTTHTPGVANGHVHGANLGIRADILRAAGGFPALTAHEDIHVVDRARAIGAQIVPSAGATVLTSGRAIGRAPEGYARYLHDDLMRLAEARADTHCRPARRNASPGVGSAGG